MIGRRSDALRGRRSARQRCSAVAWLEGSQYHQTLSSFGHCFGNKSSGFRLHRKHQNDELRPPEPPEAATAAAEGISPGGRRFAEAAAIFAVFYLLTGWPVPDVNEAHYRCKAK